MHHQLFSTATMNDATLNYRHLYYFWVVSQEGSISAAARKLDMTPQTISSQLAKLEEQTGKALFKQVGRQLELTDAGRASVLEYIILPASAFWTWAIWGKGLEPMAVVGMVLIVAAGTMIALRARVRES